MKSRIVEGKPESFLCGKVVAPDFMKSAKLKRHQEANHRSSLDSDIEYFRVSCIYQLQFVNLNAV